MLVPRVNLRKGCMFPFFEQESTLPIANTPTSGTKESHVLKKIASIGFKPFKSILLNTHNIIVYGGLLIASATFLPASWVLFNKVAQATGFVPKPTIDNSHSQNKFNFPVDSFYENFNGFDEVVNAINRAGIDTNKLHKNHKVLDSSNGIQELLTQLNHIKSNSNNAYDSALFDRAIKKLTDINIIHELLFGKDGPYPEQIQQNDEATCKQWAATKGRIQTYSQRQEFKSSFSVVDYNLDPEKFDIKMNVRITGTDYLVSYLDIVESMSQTRRYPSNTKDGSLYILFYNEALKRAEAKYDIRPNILPQIAPTLTTNKSYCTVGLWAYTNNDIREIAKKAPETMINIGSSFTLEDIDSGLRLRAEGENYVPSHSNEKEKEFKTRVSKKTQEIITTIPKSIQPVNPLKTQNIIKEERVSLEGQAPIEQNTQPQIQSTLTALIPTSLILNIQTTSPSQRSTDPTYYEVNGPGHLITGHVYVIEKYDEEKDEIIISDSTNASRRIRLSINDVRDKMSGFILPEEDAGLISQRGLIALPIAITLGLLYRTGKKKLKVVFFGEKNKIQTA